MVTIQTTIRGASPPTPHAALAWVERTGAERLTFARTYFVELHRLCILFGLRFEVLVGQWDLETDSGASELWVATGNPAGIAKFDDGTYAGLVYRDGVAAARAQVVHMLAYVAGAIPPDSPAHDWIGLDPRYGAVFDEGFAGSVEVVGDLGNGRWATDARYAPKLVERATAIFGMGTELPEGSAMDTFGNVTHPPYVDRTIPDEQNFAWDDLGPVEPWGCVRHTMVGSLWGTDSWFRRGVASNGLTHYGVGGSTDGPRWDGVIFLWNDPRGRGGWKWFKDRQVVPEGTPGAVRLYVSPNRSGWANGGSDGLEGDGLGFVRRLGITPINRNLVSIERSDGGNIGTPVSAKQGEAIARIEAYWFDQAHVPWDRYPVNPRVDLVTDFFHLEFATKGCPHPAVTATINDSQDRTRAILKAAQTQSAGEPAEPPPSPIENPHNDRWPNGWTTAELTKRWGDLIRVEPGGTEVPEPFDERHPLCNAWVARGAREGRQEITDLPRPVRWFGLRPDADQRTDIVIFQRNVSEWVAVRPDPAVAWRWVN